MLLPRAALSPVLGLLLALPTTIASAHFSNISLAPTERERSQLLLAEGDTAYDDGRLDQAISKYRASYYGLSVEDQASYLGSLPVRKAMRAYEQRIAAEPDPATQRSLLQRQRVMLVEFLDAVASKQGAADEVGEDVIAELEDKRRAIEGALAGPKTDFPDDPGPRPPANDGAETNPIEPAEPIPADDPRPPRAPPSRDWLGLGLVIGGGTTILVGAGVTIGYFTIQSGAEALVNAGGGDYAPGTQRREDYLAGEQARARPFLIAGSVVAGVGLAVAVSGTVRLVLHRRRSTMDTAAASALTPILTPSTAGLAFHRRF